MPPAAASYISSMGSTSSGSRTSSWMCLLVLRIEISAKRMGSMYGSTSQACGDGHTASTSESASPSLTKVARSSEVPSRRSPVRSSYT